MLFFRVSHIIQHILDDPLRQPCPILMGDRFICILTNITACKRTPQLRGKALERLLSFWSLNKEHFFDLNSGKKFPGQYFLSLFPLRVGVKMALYLIYFKGI